MMAPAGHVTVVVVKADVPEPHTVEYSDGEPERLADTVREAVTLMPKVGVRDDVGDTDAVREGEAATDAVREGEAATDAVRERDTVREAVTLDVTTRDREGVTLSPRDTEGVGVAKREDERDALGDALASLHCT